MVQPDPLSIEPTPPYRPHLNPLHLLLIAIIIVIIIILIVVDNQTTSVDFHHLLLAVLERICLYSFSE